jgi:putative cofactor-binding repeat protein
MPPTRFDVAQEALLKLLDTYKLANGEVLVNLVVFSSATQTKALNAGQPMNLAEAIDAVNDLKTPTSANAGTYYGTALTTALPLVQEGLDKHSDSVNQVFFISDGAPQSTSGGSTGAGVTVPQDWKQLVNNTTGYDADNLQVYAVGVGGEANTKNAQAALNSVIDPTHGDKYIYVDNFNELGIILQDLSSVAGNLVVENILGADGISQIFAYTDPVSGEQIPFPWGNAHELDSQGFFTLRLAEVDANNYAELRINEDGYYTLSVVGKVDEGDYKNINIILTDGDGDELGSDISIAIQSAPEVIHATAEFDYGSSGDNILYGGGEDIFAWKLADMGGTDTIKNFTHNFTEHTGDVLRFDALFNDNSQHDLVELLTSAQWDSASKTITAGGENDPIHITMTLTDGQVQLDVTTSGNTQHIVLEGCNFNSQVQDNDTALLLLNEIIKVGGNA